MGSIPVGSTKNDCEDSRFFNPDSESKDAYRRPASRTLGKLADAREYQKADTFVSVCAIPTRNRRTAFRRPDSRTLGRLAAIREYQNDCEDSRFYMMKRKG